MKDFLVWVVIVGILAIVGTVNYYILPQWNDIVRTLGAFLMIPLEMGVIFGITMVYHVYQDRH